MINPLLVATDGYIQVHGKTSLAIASRGYLGLVIGAVFAGSPIRGPLFRDDEDILDIIIMIARRLF